MTSFSSKGDGSGFQRLRTVYPKGSVIFREEDLRDNAYIVESGVVEITTTRNGKQVPLVRLGKGEVFGETALLGDGPRSATAIAVEDTEVFTISPRLLRDRVMGLDPLVGLLMSLLVNRYRQWRFVSPEVAENIGAVTNDTDDGNGVLGADFLQDLQQQKNTALDELRMSQEIIRAIDNREFVPYLQPIVTLPDQKLVGFEALIRWQHPERGMVAPNSFIAVAERTQVVRTLDMLMLRYVCEILPDLQKTAGDDVYVTVNLSGAYFDDNTIVDDIRRVLHDTAANPAHIVVEVTESALMNEPAVAEQVLAEIKALGLRIALDDFGTGYSSLGYLHRFPIDILKIDRTFVRDIDSNRKSLDVVRAIVSLARTFNLKIVGEGIEDGSQIEALAAIGCDYGQGYFFSKPVPVSAAHDFIRTLPKTA